MDTKALRQKVLDLAIRGKLVAQDPNDEPASVLLERIRQQKQQMVKEGKLKAKDIKNDSIIFVGEDNLHYEKFPDGSVKCIEDEILFELPDGWAWSKIGPLCEYITSGSRGWAQYYSESGSLFLRMGNLSRDSFDLRLDSLQRVNLPDNAEGTRTRVAENDLLFSITAEIGMLGLIPANFEEAYINQHVGLIRFLKDAQTKYFPYILMSEFCRDQYYTVQSGMKNSFRLDNIQNILVPVPPLGEQVRIAEKLSSIWTYIHQIDIESETTTDIISKTKSKILDLAIRGQLVPQDPNDEPASVLLERIRAEKEELIKQGKIKRDKKESVIFRGEDNSYYEKIGNEIRCIEEEIPFEIPKSWRWCRLCSLSDIVMGSSPSGESICDDQDFAEFHQGKSYFSDCMISYSGQHTKEITKMAEPGAVLLCVRAPVGEVNLTNRSICIGRGLAAVKAFDHISEHFLFYWLQAFKGVLISKATGTTFVAVTTDVVKGLLIPVPPLQEQRRILTRIKSACAELDKVEKSLN